MTVNDALLGAAYRMGYDSVPSDANEKARWIYQCDDAQRSVLRKNLYWFTQTTSSDVVVSGKQRYDLASDFREMIEVRLNGMLVQPITAHEGQNSYNVPFSGVPIQPSSSTYAYSYYMFGDREMNLLPLQTSVPDTLTAVSATRTGSTVTVTTSDAHGYSIDDYVTIAGAVETGYNGAQRITTVPTTTTFTYEITTTPTTPATGTVTHTKRNIVYSYYKNPTRLTALTDTLLIPDLYLESFVSYIKARIDLRDSERASASDGFDEFNELVNDLNEENNRRKWLNVNINPY